MKWENVLFAVPCPLSFQVKSVLVFDSGAVATLRYFVVSEIGYAILPFPLCQPLGNRIL